MDQQKDVIRPGYRGPEEDGATTKMGHHQQRLEASFQANT